MVAMKHDIDVLDLGGFRRPRGADFDSAKFLTTSWSEMVKGLTREPEMEGGLSFITGAKGAEISIPKLRSTKSVSSAERSRSDYLNILGDIIMAMFSNVLTDRRGQVLLHALSASEYFLR